MSTMLVEVYDALKEAGASEEKARAAAASLTGRDDRFDRLGARIDELERRFDQLGHRVEEIAQDVAVLKADVALLKGDVATLKTDAAVIMAELTPMKWMHGLTIGGIFALRLRRRPPAPHVLAFAPWTARPRLEVSMRILLALAIALLLPPGEGRAEPRPAVGGLDLQHCARVGKVLEPAPGGAGNACCYDDGCWVCAKGWQGCAWNAGADFRAGLRGAMTAPGATAPPGARDRTAPAAMQSAPGPAIVGGGSGN